FEARQRWYDELAVDTTVNSSDVAKARRRHTTNRAAGMAQESDVELLELLAAFPEVRKGDHCPGGEGIVFRCDSLHRLCPTHADGLLVTMTQPLGSSTRRCLAPTRRATGPTLV